MGGGWGEVGVGRGSMPVMKSTQMMGPPQKLSVLADLGLHTPSSNYCYNSKPGLPASFLQIQP